MAHIHALAVVDSSAQIGQDVHIGPFSLVEPNVIIGDRCRLAARVVIKSGVKIGPENEFSEGAVIGGRPQHIKAGDYVGGVTIGVRNVFRENVTVHCGMMPGFVTQIGNHNMLMVGSHVGHDCVLEDHLVVANNVMLAGHVTVQHHAYLSGAVGVHQFCRVGAFAMVGGQSHVHKDVLPFVTIDGMSSSVVGLNTVGLKRNGFSASEIRQLKDAYRVIFRRGLTWNETLEALRSEFPHGPASNFLPFMAAGKRGFLHERRTPRNAFIPMVTQQNDSESEPLRVHRAA